MASFQWQSIVQFLPVDHPGDSATGLLSQALMNSRGFVLSIPSSKIRSVERLVMLFSSKVAQQRHMLSLRDGMVSAMPFYIVGSIVLLVTNLPTYHQLESIPALGELIGYVDENRMTILQPYYATMGLSCLIISFAMAHSLAKHYRISAVSAGFLSMYMLIITAGKFGGDPVVLDITYLGSRGMVMAIFTSIAATEIYRFMHAKGLIIRLPDEVPPAIALSFGSILPIVAITATVYLFSAISFHLMGEARLPEITLRLVLPVIESVDTLPGVLVIVFLIQIFWFFGIHGSNVFIGIINTVSLTNLQINQSALKAGSEPAAVLSAGFLDSFVFIGGCGATLGLTIALLIHRYSYFRSIGRFSILPGLFNINDPLVFGLPLILNPTLGIPFIVVPLLNTTIAYLATHYGLIGHIATLIPWSTPSPIAALLGTNFDYSAMLLSLLLLTLSVFCYLPFLNAYAKTLKGKQDE